MRGHAAYSVTVTSHSDHRSVSQASLEEGETGRVPAGPGWFVLNAREARWQKRLGRGLCLPVEGKTTFPQVGINLFVIGSGEPIGMYHWEADQEDFVVLAGEALLIVEGQERPLRQWDFVHCPPGTRHMIVGAGRGSCVVLAVGAREHQGGPAWGGYSVDEAALRHGAGLPEETIDETRGFEGLPHPEPTPYREGWLPS
jgi:quercetin dioxygenase-like cupin family protein